MTDLRKCAWKDHPKNPLIEPPGREWMIADPTVVTPDRSPDGLFHLFANSVGRIHHYVSSDGIAWDKSGGALFRGLRPSIFAQDGYHIFYERFDPPRQSVIAVRSSTDLQTWSEPRNVLAPSLPWEGRFIREVCCASVVLHKDRYRMYFSGGWVWLKDCYFLEPKHIGVAESKSLFGPYEKRPEPIISPSKELYWRNLGAGSIKALPPGDGAPWLAFNNGIYVDQNGQSRSEIHLLESDDGLVWRDVHGRPILAPEPGWKRALVYAMHYAAHGGKHVLYYNARDGWFRGRERIGAALAEIE